MNGCRTSQAPSQRSALNASLPGGIGRENMGIKLTKKNKIMLGCLIVGYFLIPSMLMPVGSFLFIIGLLLLFMWIRRNFYRLMQWFEEA
jgi:hypothetical protein